MQREYTWRSLEDKCLSLVAEQLGVDREKITIGTNFLNDLGADSLDIVEMVMEFEEEFDINIPDEAAERFHTLADGLQHFLETMPRALLAKVDTHVIAFELLPDGTIRVRLQTGDGSWAYSDGTKILPSKLFVFTLSQWEPILKQLEELINDPKAKEADLQDLLEQYPELLAGDDYDVVIPQAAIHRDDNLADWKADFVLAPINQVEFAKIIDLKLPQLDLTKRPRSGHVQFTAKLWDGICQLRDYANAFDREHVRNIFRNTYKTDVFKPDVHLIAGRRWDMQWIDNIKSLRRSTDVRIEDWDSVLDRLKRRFT